MLLSSWVNYDLTFQSNGCKNRLQLFSKQLQCDYMVTIRDVADKAGVSVGTVSRVMNNKMGVSDQTRQHVMAVSQEMGYLLTKRSFNAVSVTHLGLLIRPLGEPVAANPFFGAIFNAIEQTCRDRQVNLTFGVLDIINGELRTLPTMLTDERISGYILVGAMPRGVVQAFTDATHDPVVLIDNTYPDAQWDSLMIDNFGGATQATELLIAWGHRRIVFISGPDHPSIIERQSGYEQVMYQHHLQSVVITAPNLDPVGGESALQTLLIEEPESTGIICSNDSQAIGIMSGLHAIGRSIPEDFSLIGFDNIPMAQFTHPPITTVHTDRNALGQLATQLLLGRIYNPDRQPIHVRVGVRLISRSSVAAPRADN
jgi:LacI family transcriptional regulator